MYPTSRNGRIDLGLTQWLVAPLATGFLVYQLVRFLRKKRKFIDAMERLPGPPLEESHPWLAQLDPYIRSIGTLPNHPKLPHAYDFFVTMGRPFCREGLFRFWAFNPYRVPFARSVVAILDPEMAKQLLTNREITTNIVKEKRIYKLASPLIADSFLQMPDYQPEWKLHRRIVARSFHQQFLECATATVVRILSTKAFPAWDQRIQSNGASKATTVEMVEFATRLTLDVLGEVAFSCTFGGLDHYSKNDADPEEEESLYDLYRFMLTMLTRIAANPPFASWFWIRDQIRYWRSQRRLNNLIHDIIRERMNENETIDTDGNNLNNTKKEHRRDLLSFLLEEHEDGCLPYKYVFGTTRMFVFAGHDTTAGALAGILWQVAKHLQVQERLQKEVDEVFAAAASAVQNDEQKPPSATAPSFREIMQMKYLDAVVKEALRFHTPALVGRTVIDDVTVTNRHGQSFVLPAGTSIYNFAILSTHIMDEYYPEPTKFQPERFLTENQNDGKSHYASRNWSYPFSFGPRNCVGQPLAMAELKVILAHIVHRYKLKVHDDAIDPTPVFTLTVKPHEVLLDVESR